jgi:hypothetical protein
MMPRALAMLAAAALLATWAAPAWAKTEKPTAVAEEFFRLLAAKDYAEAADLLSSADQAALTSLKSQMGTKGKNINLEKILADSFYMLQAADSNPAMAKKNDAETIMPERVSFYVPGQHYIERSFAAVFTRETYELAHNNTGPVRDDPRKLWVDPTNVLSKVRDEAYFKQWWVWEGDRLTMPGLLWMVKEKNSWKIDLFAGAVPRRAFDADLFLYFGRDVFESDKSAKKKPAPEPKKSPPAKSR